MTQIGLKLVKKLSMWTFSGGPPMKDLQWRVASGGFFPVEGCHWRNSPVKDCQGLHWQPSTGGISCEMIILSTNPRIDLTI